VCVEYAEDAYQQVDRLMLVHRDASSETADERRPNASSSATLAMLSPPAKRTGRRRPSARVTTCLEYLENLEMSGNLKHVREMSGKKSCHGKVSQNCSLLDEH